MGGEASAGEGAGSSRESSSPRVAAGARVRAAVLGAAQELVQDSQAARGELPKLCNMLLGDTGSGSAPMESASNDAGRAGRRRTVAPPPLPGTSAAAPGSAGDAGTTTPSYTGPKLQKSTQSLGPGSSAASRAMQRLHAPTQRQPSTAQPFAATRAQLETPGTEAGKSGDLQSTAEHATTSQWGMLALCEQHPVYYQELKSYRQQLRKDSRVRRENRSLFVSEGEFAAPLSKAVCNTAIPEAGDAVLFGQPWAMGAEAAANAALARLSESSHPAATGAAAAGAAASGAASAGSMAASVPSRAEAGTAELGGMPAAAISGAVHALVADAGLREDAARSGTGGGQD